MEKITINDGGKEYSANWDTLALKQYLRTAKELAASGLSGEAYSLAQIELPLDSARALMIRAGMLGEQFDAVDPELTSKMAGSILKWYMRNMKQLTDNVSEEAREEAKKE